MFFPVFVQWIALPTQSSHTSRIESSTGVHVCTSGDTTMIGVHWSDWSFLYFLNSHVVDSQVSAQEAATGQPQGTILHIFRTHILPC